MSQVLRVLMAAADVAALPMIAMAEGAATPGIDTSLSRSATIPTGSMPPGSEMWALWITLPAGKKVEGKEPKVTSQWMDLEMGLTGSTVSAPTSGTFPKNQCLVLGAKGPVSLTGEETTTGPGEGFACHFSTGVPYWEENRGSDLYSRAQLNVGGPWVPGMYDTVDAYRGAGGDTRALRVDPVSFRKVEAELRAAGMMTATTRVVTMAPGSRSVSVDRYPTLRMLTSGELKWGSLPADAAEAAMPKGMFKLGMFNWIDWTKPQQVVLANESQAPAQFVEWSVAPAETTDP